MRYEQGLKQARRRQQKRIHIMPKYTLWGKEVELDIDRKVFLTDDEMKAREALYPCQHCWFQSPCSGLQLHYRVSLPTGSSPLKGVVVFHPGIQDESGRGVLLKNGRKVAGAYVAEELVRAGYAFYSLDAYGHGFSEGLRFYVQDWKHNRDDFEHLAQMVAKEHGDETPLFLMGDSYGGCLTLHVAGLWEDKARAPSSYKGIVLTAPAIVSDLPPKPVVWFLRYLMAPLFPTRTPFFMPNPVSADRIWSDPEVLAAFTNQRAMETTMEGGGRAFRLGTAVNLLRALEDVRQNVVPKLNVPFCVCHGKADKAVLVEGTEYLVRHAQTPETDQAVLLHEKAYHDIFSEPMRDEALRFIVAFLDERIKT